MAILSKGQTFAANEQVVHTKLNNLVDAATFASGAVDGSTTQLSGGAIIIKDLGITTSKIADGAVTGDKIAALSAIDINGGAIDGTPIGANSASTGAFTTLSAGSGAFTVSATGITKNANSSRVTSNFDATSSTTLTAITGLSATLAASTTYGFEITLFVSCASAAAGFKLDLGGGTATATSLIADCVSIDNATVRSQVQTTTLTGLLYNTTGSATTPIKTVVSGTITVNADGTFIPRFAQSTSSGSASTVLAGSRMTVIPF